MSSRIARYALLGRPVAHSLSPVMQRAAFAAARIRASYEVIDAGAPEAAELFARLREARYAGWNLTTPLKETAVALVDRASDEAIHARAINVVRAEADGSLSGHNTDGTGLVHALRDLWSWEPRGATVLVLGSGPAARAVTLALRAHGADLACWSRNAQRAALLAPPLARTPALVVSALPADATLPPYILHAADDETVLFDLNYRSDRSPLDGMRGRRRSDGLPLLLHQGALSFTFWTGRPAPLAEMRAALGEYR